MKEKLKEKENKMKDKNTLIVDPDVKHMITNKFILKMSFIDWGKTMAIANEYICKDLKDNIVFIAPVVSLVHPSTLIENYNKREALRWTDKIFEEQKDLDKITLQIEEFKRAMDKMTDAQKEKEMSAIELLIKEQELKQDHSFLQSLFRKKSA